MPESQHVSSNCFVFCFCQQEELSQTVEIQEQQIQLKDAEIQTSKVTMSEKECQIERQSQELMEKEKLMREQDSQISTLQQVSVCTGCGTEGFRCNTTQRLGNTGEKFGDTGVIQVRDWGYRFNTGERLGNICVIQVRDWGIYV